MSDKENDLIREDTVTEPEADAAEGAREQRTRPMKERRRPIPEAQKAIAVKVDQAAVGVTGDRGPPEEPFRGSRRPPAPHIAVRHPIGAVGQHELFGCGRLSLLQISGSVGKGDLPVMQLEGS